MTTPKRISVGPVGEHIALSRWGEDGSGKPPALLLHGTGFVAEVWDEVARELASRYTVYALDRNSCLVPCKYSKRKTARSIRATILLLLVSALLDASSG
jgi:hypothetical protein